MDTYTCLDIRDRLSHLPEDLINLILSFLPLKNAVATSILSRNWRYKWVNIPNIVFDDDSVEVEDDQAAHKLVKAITNVLISHTTGLINKFVLSHKRFQPVTATDDWINSYLSKAPLQDFRMCIRPGDPYKIPSSVFYFQNLVHLTLHNCAIESLPSTFTGFKKLIYMRLEDMKSSSQAVVDDMISSSPSLKMLILRNLEGVSCLSISAPRLWYLWIKSPLKDVSVGANRLQIIIMILTDRTTEEEVQPVLSDNMNLSRFFYPLKNAKKFWFKGRLLKYFSIGHVPVQLPSRYLHMKVLSMTLDAVNTKEVSACLCILRSCPNLEELSINLWREHEIWENNLTPPCHLPQLKRLLIYSVNESEGEMQLIKFLLLSTPKLQLLVLLPCILRCSDLLKEITQFQRASPQAEVVGYHCSEYDSVIETRWDGSFSLKKK